VSKRTLLEFQLQKIAAVTAKYNTTIPVVVVTSEATTALTKELLEQYHYGGLSPDRFCIAVQPSLPVIGTDGAPSSNSDGTPMTAPAGHGSTLSALKNSEAIAWLKASGVEHVFCFQYPNVMEVMCDPELIGTHVIAKLDATLKATPASETEGRVGRLVITASGDLHVIEYYRFDTDPSLEWARNNPVNLGTYVWDLSFLERCVANKIVLPWHAVRHRLAHDSRELWKAEQFIFDLLEHTDRAGFMLVGSTDHYAIVKHREGNDSLESARKALSHAYCRWLTTAGAVTEEADPAIEIDPRFALGPNDLAAKIAPGFRYGDGLILNPK
jgi:UDP-N-acetylglucosamine/UDP-N-acetylgalactosamine diphosphorylase